MSSKDKDSEEIEKGAMDKKEKEEVSKEDNVTENKDEKKDDQDVVFVQDVGFTVKIIAPNLEPFDIQVNKPSKNIPSKYIFCKFIRFQIMFFRCHPWNLFKRFINC